MLSRQTSELDQLEDHLRVGPEVQLDLVADGDVLDRLGHQERKPVAAVLAEDADHAVRQRRGAELRFLVVGQQVHAHQLRRRIPAGGSGTGS